MSPYGTRKEERKERRRLSVLDDPLHTYLYDKGCVMSLLIIQDNTCWLPHLCTYRLYTSLSQTACRHHPYVCRPQNPAGSKEALGGATRLWFDLPVVEGEAVKPLCRLLLLYCQIDFWQMIVIVQLFESLFQFPSETNLHASVSRYFVLFPFA